MKKTEETAQLTLEYAELIRPHLELAKRAYGSRNQNTPAHIASREYTRLLVEFVSKGGSLMDIAKELGVAYSGVRRRVFTANVPSVKSSRKQRSKISTETIEEAVDRVQFARALSTEDYHRQLHEEFTNGIPMNLLARSLGISNAAPLYYGVQRHYKILIDKGLAS